jgi:hypothetical protein
MMWLARWALLVALSLLTSAATAYAECAWVLWTQAVDPRTRVTQGDWHPAAGYNSRQECTLAAEQLSRNLMSSSPTSAASTACLPDTVDPRGPKGK